MKNIHGWMALIASVSVLLGCGGSSVSESPESQRGRLNGTTAVLNSAGSQTFKNGFAANLSFTSLTLGLQLLNTGAAAVMVNASTAMPCNFEVSKINYNTVGAVGEAASASAAVMVPVATSGNTKCNGPFPVVLAAHGTTSNKDYDLSNFMGSGEGVLLAAMFAAQGYVVVAPNYAGYDTSNLSYHPYLILSQQSKDMQDALTAARASNLFTANSKLFVTGYSQGGAVALATQRDMEAAGITVTASAPGSGPYAMLSFGDTIFAGKPNRGGTIFTPLLVDAAQKAYGNLYSTPGDIYSDAFKNSVVGLMPARNLSMNPSFVSLTTANLLPTAGTETGIFGIGTGALYTSAARTSYNSDASSYPVTGTTLPASVSHPLRQALLKNDLRSGWLPTAPTQLCGASNDPVVFIENTTLFKSYANAKSASNLVNVLNLSDPVSGANDPYAAYKTAYAASLGAITFTSALTHATEVHGGIAGFCYLAAYGLFKSR